MHSRHELIESTRTIIALGLAEDIGGGDVTTLTLVPEGAQASMRLVAREPLIACGAQLLPLVFGESVQVEGMAEDGLSLAAGEALATLHGPARTLLTGERVALNLLQRLCGIATLTARYVGEVQGTHAQILDTRKTIPGWRLLDKYAVRAGGGVNHRMGLYDMVLIKDNHIALCGGVAQAVARAREGMQRLGMQVPVEVECDTLAQLEQALEVKVERILLDNMNVASLREAVRITHGMAKLEASGGITLERLRMIAETGVDYISIGALTHSARAADIGADIEMR